jgi:uncharacterized membrane protein YoaK (UPF0700 family)
MVATASGWALASHTARQPGSTPGLDILLGCLALAIGIQSGAMLQLRIPGIVTTYITGTWTQLMRGLTRFVTRKRNAAMATGLLFRYARPAVGVLPAVSVSLVAAYTLAHRPSTTA